MGVKFNPFTGNLDLIDTTAAAGADTQVQFNNGGSLAGSADLTWDDTAKELGVGGDINLDDGGTYATTLQLITPTANRTISFPDATGTVGLVGGSSGQLVYNNAGAYAGAPSTSVGASGDITLSANGAASTGTGSAFKLTGDWFAGANPVPQALIQPASTTTSTTWSTSGTGLGVNAASTFSGNLLDLQVNGASRFKLGSNGFVYGNASGTSALVLTGASDFGSVYFGSTVAFAVIASGGVKIRDTFSYSWAQSGNATNSTDLSLFRDAANTLAQRNGTNAQTYRLYNSYTDASNYQRTSITDDSTGLVIDQQYAGTGAARTNLLDLQVNGTSKVFFGASGNSAASPAIRMQSSSIWTPSGGSIAFGGTSGAAGLMIEGGLGAGFTNSGLLWWASNSTTGFYSQRDVALKRDQANVLAITDGSTGTGYLKQTPVAVSALPAAATVGAGTRGFVSDSTVAASGNFGATVTGGGSNNVPVFSDGTNWLIG